MLSRYLTSPLSGPQAASPALRTAQILRLVLMQVSPGMLSIVLGSILGRVMVVEQSLPASLTALVLATPGLSALIRPVIGRWSDQYPWLGRHRVSYIRLGTLLAWGLALLLGWAVLSVGTGWLEWSLPQRFLGAVFLLLLAFLQGCAQQLASTPYSALLVDRAATVQRSRVIAAAWAALSLGAILTALATAPLLRSLGPADIRERLLPLILLLAIPALGLMALGSWRAERPVDRSHPTPALPLRAGIRSSLQRPEARSFLTLLGVYNVALFLPDTLLEAYGAQIFSMPVGDTTRLTGIWAIGGLLTLLLGGFALVPRWGTRRVMQAACVCNAGSFLMMALAGFSAQPLHLSLLVLLFGFGTGLGASALLTRTMELTRAGQAGLEMGIWGTGLALAKLLGTLAGGVLLDGFRLLLGTGWSSYAAVLGVATLGMGFAMRWIRAGLAPVRAEAEGVAARAA